MCCTYLLSCVQLFVTPWTVAHQASLSMGFSRQEYWSGFPCLLQGILQTKDQTQVFCIANGFFTNWATTFGKTKICNFPVPMYFFFSLIQLVFYFILFFNFTILYRFCHISTWILYRYTHVPHPMYFKTKTHSNRCKLTYRF